MFELAGKKIAVVGVSRDPSKYGHKVFQDLIKKGYDVYGVNPKQEPVLGRRIYPSLSQLPEKPDIVITVVPPAVTEKIVEECASLGIGLVWMQPGSESQEAIRKAELLGIRTIHDACIMLTTDKRK